LILRPASLASKASRPVNTSRFVFLDPRAEASYGDWDRIATETVAMLRCAAGRDPYDRDLSDLVTELATQSEAFRIRWASHNVRFHNTGVKHFYHPVVAERARCRLRSAGRGLRRRAVARRPVTAAGPGRVF
jgi:hypothetical protein